MAALSRRGRDRQLPDTQQPGGQPAEAGASSLRVGRGQRCAGLKGFTLPSPSRQPGDQQDVPRQALAGGHNPDTTSLLPQTPASVLPRSPCRAPQDSPQADMSLSKGPACAWLCVPTCDSLVPPQHQPLGGPRHGHCCPLPPMGAWHARRSRAGQQAPPDPRGAGRTATYPLCWGVQAGTRGTYVTGFITSPGRGFGGEPAPKGRAVLLRVVLGAKLYFRGSEQGSES